MLFAGVTATDVSVAFVTASVAVPLIPLIVAVIVTEPALLPVANPLCEMEAIGLFDDFQSANEVTSLVLPSLSCAVAVSCSLVLTGMDELPGCTETDVTVCADNGAAPNSMHTVKMHKLGTNLGTSLLCNRRIRDLSDTVPPRTFF